MIKTKLMLLTLLLCCGVSQAAEKYTRRELVCKLQLPTTAEAFANKIAPSGLSEQDQWFVTKEIVFLNSATNPNGIYNPGDLIKYPLYRPYANNGVMCGDMRNWHVASLKGHKYHIGPSFMIGIRTHENPSCRRDHYAYGVVCKQGTDLWTQAEWGAKIARQICDNKGINDQRPSQSELYRFALTYVGTGSASAQHWAACVNIIRNRALGPDINH